MASSRTGEVTYDVLRPTAYPKWVLSCHQHIGRRKAQEDRFALCPALYDQGSAFFGVWDGTVGDFASHNIRSLVLPHLLASKHWKAFRALGKDRVTPEHLRTLEDATKESFVKADNELVGMCRAASNHYASSTGVTALITGGVLTVGWLGDSRVALGYDQGGKLCSEFLTVDHKPDQPGERARIEASGGSVEYLHNSFNKPFIRGGDFTRRKALGEKPMQLQYSRAFGGKDLKPYGLSNQADVKQVVLAPQHKVLVLASDGLWDVCSDQTAVAVAMEAAWQGRDASQALVAYALSEQDRRGGTADNVTVACVFFAEERDGEAGGGPGDEVDGPVSSNGHSSAAMRNASSSRRSSDSRAERMSR